MIDENLLEEAHRLSGHSARQETLDEALREYVQRRKRLAIPKSFGSFDFDEQYDYKRERGSRPDLFE
jgi:hypothetical protein